MKKQPPKNTPLVGTLHAHPRGFGFVTLTPPHPTFQKDVFIPKAFMHRAVDGDTVEIQLDGISEKGPEGRVIAIVRRGKTHLAGTILSVSSKGAVAYVPLLGKGRFAQVALPKKGKLVVGDRVVLHVLEWGEGHEDTHCELAHKIGSIDEPSCDVPAAIEEFALRGDFPIEVIEEAQSFGKRVYPRDLAGRENLCDLETVTIDPKSAKDFDDAISLSEDSKGYRLIVHIADVSHYVRLGSFLDDEAALRGNSTYFPGFCLPMLPHELSDHLCSLKPGVQRLAVSVFLDFSKTGTLRKSRIARTVIRSDKRFSYEDAMEILEGKKKSPHAPLLHRMVELCEKLKKKRSERGSVDLAVPGIELRVDQEGNPQGIDIVEYDITHQMIEEFMLKANEVIAMSLTRANVGVAYRVHEEPSAADLQGFVLMARSFGLRVSDEPTSEELQELFLEAKGKPYSAQLSVAFIRSMKLATYSSGNIGHYGLKLEFYCHFTSPIRRYADLIVHRALFEGAPEEEVLQALTERCSRQERVSARAEASVTLLKKLRLLERYEKEDPGRSYKAVITQAKPFGLIFEVSELMLEGFLHISTLGEDYYVLERSGMALQGRHTGERFACGDMIVVSLEASDLITGECRWEMAHEEASSCKRSPKKKSDRSSKKTKDKKRK